MRQVKLWLWGVAAFFWGTAAAHINPELHNKPKNQHQQQVRYREACTTAKAQIDQGVDRLNGGKINNVRARLTTGGDVWWDRNDGKYVVPHVDPGEPEVSSIFAGAVWLGGYDPAGNLKVAAQTYGNANSRSDFWPGPLDPETGTTDLEICNKWDRFFEVYGREVELHRALWEQAQANGTEYDPEMIPRGVKGWPARGNPFFFQINEFELPNTGQGLAGFWDENGDGLYNPLDGDFPIVEIRGCDSKPTTFPDQMIFWIYNDNGNIHTESNGSTPIQMEVQVQAFSYSTNDEINDMTFQRYKLINRAIEDIDSTYFAMWVDADLGCYTDDYVGCDTSRSLAYTYNADAEDGDVGTSCPGGVNTYGTDIPIIGVDYFRGPLNEFGEEIGMSAFTYYNNGGVGNPPPGTTDPQTAQEFYNYLSGSWRDGSPFTYGDDGYQDGAPISYAFTEPPNDPNGWSMCTADLPEYDRRTIQASGPFKLEPSAINELIIGAVWVPKLEYPCPDIRRLLLADDLAQALFDNCFEITRGPDAPDIDWIELDREVIAVLTNDTLTSNNAYEQYTARDLRAPEGVEDSLYRFEGYMIYQLKGPEVTRADLNDPSKARLIYQVDVENGIGKIFNWSAVEETPTEEPIWVPQLMVDGQDQGIRHTFRITNDAFATGSDTRLINHKKYYFLAIAYGYNNYEPFDPVTAIGQKRPFIDSDRNIKTYTVIPRPVVDRAIRAGYGDGAIVTRLDGVGAGGNFLDISQESEQAILDGTFDGTITYKPGGGPVDVKVFNPLDVVDGEFELTFIDSDMSDDVLDPDARWKLTDLSNPSNPVISERTIETLNEQILAQYGFSISIKQTIDVGEAPQGNNGTIGATIEYADPTKPFWFIGVRDDEPNSPFPGAFNFVATRTGEPDFLLDQKQALSQIGDGYFVPYQICDYRARPTATPPFYVTPAWTRNGNIVRDPQLLREVNNVDIVLTPNKELWSRCVIVEMATDEYKDLGLLVDGDRDQFDVRYGESVGKEDTDGDGKPDPDGDGRGMGWFPGYAIDVETGKRLNIFFGENSVYDCENPFCDAYDDGQPTGRDMMFNPTSQLFLNTQTFTNIFNFVAGGQHIIYVTNQEYDGCEKIRQRLDPEVSPSPLKKVKAIKWITWAGIAMTAPGERMLSYADGLIPNEVRIKLRVDNPYQVVAGTGDYNGYPTYRLKLEGVAPTALTEPQVESALDMINVVPNPYYGFSDYESSQFDKLVKITNLPAKCTVTIYSLDGKFIRRYDRDEVGIVPPGNNRAIARMQYAPDVEWDLKNHKGIPIASGVYLIHVKAPGLGERTIKWFGINREFDPSGL